MAGRRRARKLTRTTLAVTMRARKKAKLLYLNLGSMLKAAAARGDVKEVERLSTKINRIWKTLSFR